MLETERHRLEKGAAKTVLLTLGLAGEQGEYKAIMWFVKRESNLLRLEALTFGTGWGKEV